MAVEAGICGTWVKTGCESPITCEGCCCCAAHCSCRPRKVDVADIKSFEYVKGADGEVHVQLNDGSGNAVNLATIRNDYRVEMNTTISGNERALRRDILRFLPHAMLDAGHSRVIVFLR